MFYILQCLCQLEGGKVVGVRMSLCMCESERRELFLCPLSWRVHHNFGHDGYTESSTVAASKNDPVKHKCSCSMTDSLQLSISAQAVGTASSLKGSEASEFFFEADFEFFTFLWLVMLNYKFLENFFSLDHF